MTETNTILANPAPLGLLGFGLTTILLNISNAGIFPVSAVILSMGIFYGGLAQIIAGLMEYKKGNTFGTTAFTSYGLFWISLVTILLLPSISFIKGATAAIATDPGFLGWYFFLWGLFTMFMFVATLKKNTGLQVIFFTLFILFYLLALKEWGYISGDWIGYEGILCGFSAFYTAMAEVINETFGRTILPLGKPVIK